MYFDTAGIEINPLIPPLVSFAISIFTSMGGVSGAFIILPFQMSVLGFVSPAVSSTNQLYNIVAIPSGVWRYIKEGRMVWPLTWIVVVGTLPGVLLGAIVRLNYFTNPKNFKFFAAFVLFYMGYRLVSDLFKNLKNKNNNSAKSAEDRFQELIKSYRTQEKNSEKPLPRIKVIKFSLKQIIYDFYGERYDIPALKIFTISLVVGIVGGIYGIGGGAIMAPIYVAFFKLPIYTVAGAALMGTFITSIAGVVFYQILAPFYPKLQVAPDYMLGFLFGIGGFLGMYCGARLQKFMSANFIKWVLAFCIFFLSTKYILEFLHK
ncbi:MAG: sulfite exporter TauE/SafE family protein [Desulfobacterales bacterium]|nr:sulfite exporter TauE/SafE family protein [Desulfobacterales bacterium]MBF0398589.1 sulfite exporter TauE/SafE family protein [Desulfobacterales bacterium]